jgi:hypothetical protein
MTESHEEWQEFRKTSRLGQIDESGKLLSGPPDREGMAECR